MSTFNNSGTLVFGILLQCCFCLKALCHPFFQFLFEFLLHAVVTQRVSPVALRDHPSNDSEWDYVTRRQTSQVSPRNAPCSVVGLDTTFMLMLQGRRQRVHEQKRQTIAVHTCSSPCGMYLATLLHPSFTSNCTGFTGALATSFPGSVMGREDEYTTFILHCL